MQVTERPRKRGSCAPSLRLNAEAGRPAGWPVGDAVRLWPLRAAPASQLRSIMVLFCPSQCLSLPLDFGSLRRG